MMTRLVVGYDGSAGARAGVRWALDEAARAGGRVELMFAAEWPAYPPAAPMVPGIVVWPDAQTQRRTHDMLAAARDAAAASHPGVPVTTSLVRLPAPVALVERSRDATLVVLGSHGHGGFSGALLGSVSLTVTAHAHCPVVVVRGAEGGSGDARPVVAGFDGSAGSQLALGFAFEQAAARGVPLSVLRAWPPQTPRWDDLQLDIEQVRAEEQEILEASLTTWRRKFPAVRATAEAVIDHAGHALIAASRSAQLVVVGSHGRGGLLGLLLGSVSHQVLHHGECPVAVVRERSTPHP